MGRPDRERHVCLILLPVNGISRRCDSIAWQAGGVATLFRPVGAIELDLIEASSWRRFPPRLPSQPIFYPVLTEDYATRIARDWNTKDEANGSVGYVLRVDVDDNFLDRYEVHEAGGRALLEYWIPADDLEDFNDHIVGTIEVIAGYEGQPPRRIR